MRIVRNGLGPALSAVAISGLLLSTVAPTASAGKRENPAAFYKGKTIQFIIPHGVGGGFDFYSRELALYMAKYMPGTTIVPINKPGAGGLTGTDLIASSKPDGLTIGIIDVTGTLTDQALSPKTVGYNDMTLSWLGRVSADTPVMVVSMNSPIKTIVDWQKSSSPVSFSVSGAGSDDDITINLIGKLLGLPVDTVPGFSGTSATVAAVINGTVMGTETTFGSIAPEIKSHEVRPLMVVGMDRRSEIPGVPTVAQDAWLMGASKQAQSEVADWAMIQGLNRAIAGPARIPSDRLAYLRTAMQKAMKDPGFIATMKKANREISYLPGATVGKDVRQALKDIKPLLPVLKSLPGVGVK